MAENKDKKKVKKFLKLLADSLDVKKDVSPSYLITTFTKAVNTLPEGKLKNLVQSDSENCTRLLHSYVIKRRSRCDSLTKEKVTSSSGDVRKSELHSVTKTKGKAKKADKSTKCKKVNKEKETVVISQNKEPRNFAEIYLQGFVGSSGDSGYSSAVKFLTEFLCTVEKKQESIGMEEPERAGELAEEIKTNLSICHLQFQQVGKVSSKRGPSYKDIVASLLSIYVDMMALSARNEKKKKRIGQSVCSFVCYVAEQSHLLDILLQLTVIQPEDKKVVLPLVRRCLKLVSPEGSESMYLKHMLTVCSMHKIFSDVMAGVVNTARTVPAPDSFMKWLKDTSPSVADMMPSDNKFVKYQITKFLLEELTDEMISSMLDIFTLADVEETESEDVDKQKEDVEKKWSSDVTLKNLDQSALFYLDRSGGQNPEVEEVSSPTEQNSEEENLPEIIDVGEVTETSLASASINVNDTSRQRTSRSPKKDQKSREQERNNAQISMQSAVNSSQLLDIGDEDVEKEICIEIVSDSCDSETEPYQTLLPEVTAHLKTEDWDMMSPVIDIEAKKVSRKSQSQKQRKIDSELKLETDVSQLIDETECETPRSLRSSRLNGDAQIKSSGEADKENDNIRKSVDSFVVSSSDDKSSRDDVKVMSTRQRGRISVGSHSLSAELEENSDCSDLKNNESSLTARTRRTSYATEESDNVAAVNTRSRTERRSDISVNKRTRSNTSIKQDTSSSDVIIIANSGNNNIVGQSPISELSTSSNLPNSNCSKVGHTSHNIRRKRTVSELSDSSISSRTRHRMSGVSNKTVIDLSIPEDTSNILSSSSRKRQSARSKSVSSVILEKTIDESDIEILELNTDDEYESTEVTKSQSKSTNKKRRKSDGKTSIVPSLPPDEASEVDDVAVLKKTKNDTKTKRVSQRLKQQKKNDVG